MKNICAKVEKDGNYYKVVIFDGNKKEEFSRHDYRHTADSVASAFNKGSKYGMAKMIDVMVVAMRAMVKELEGLANEATNHERLHR